MENIKTQLCSSKDCTGCMACVNSCNKSAIVIVQDNEGFYRPQINTDICVNCGLCVKACPVINPPKETYKPSTVYAAWHLNECVRNESSSGGAFSALAETILEQGGIVCGAAYVDGITIQHCIIEQKEDLYKLRLSKYAQSQIGLVFKEIKRELINGRKVLFCGTPCQAAGIRKYLVKDYENLVICDFICHGTPSIKMLQKWVQWIEKRYGEITHLNFRSKIKGWYDALRVATLKNGKKVVMRGKNDAYWVGFSSNNNLQESCYNCQFVGIERNSDITIADFWGIGKQIPFGNIDEIEKGISCIIINSSKGNNIVEESKNKMATLERTIEEVLQGNQTMLKPCKRPDSRNSIYADIESLNYEEFRQKYLSPSRKMKLVKIWREYVPSSIVKRIRTRDQK